MCNYLHSLSPSQTRDIYTLIHKYSEVFGDHPQRSTLISHKVQLRQHPQRSTLISHNVQLHQHPQRSTLISHNVQLLPGTFPIRQAPYRLNPQKHHQMQGPAVLSKSPWASPCLPVTEEDDQRHLCTDHRRENAVTVPAACPLPRVDDMIDEVGQTQYVEQGLEGVSMYIDDVLLFSDSWKLAVLLRRLQEARLTVRLASVAAVLNFTAPATEGRYGASLGWQDSTEGSALTPRKRPPHYKREIRHFLGVAAPLTNLTGGTTKHLWDPACQGAYTQSKDLLAPGPVLQAPDFTQPFTLQTYASNIASGAVLLQERNGTLHPVTYHVYTDHNSLTFLHRPDYTHPSLRRLKGGGITAPGRYDSTHPSLRRLKGGGITAPACHVPTYPSPAESSRNILFTQPWPGGDNLDSRPALSLAQRRRPDHSGASPAAPSPPLRAVPPYLPESCSAAQSTHTGSQLQNSAEDGLSLSWGCLVLLVPPLRLRLRLASLETYTHTHTHT